MLHEWLKRFRANWNVTLDNAATVNITPPAPLKVPDDYPDQVLVFFVRPARPWLHDDATRYNLYKSAALRLQAAAGGRTCIVAGIMVDTGTNTYLEAAQELSRQLHGFTMVHAWEALWVNGPAALAQELVESGLYGPVAIVADQMTIKRMAAAAGVQLPYNRSTGDLAVAVPFAFLLDPRTSRLTYLPPSGY